ncbi:cytochrome P450 4V2 [Trichonephila clavipes]|nr:cytochrome P450 4V2 [Trichonephila clavipes]
MAPSICNKSNQKPSDTHDAAKQPAIFSGNKTIDRPLIYKKFLILFGTGLITSNGTLWKSRRKMTNPCFRYDILKDYVPSLNEHAQVLVKRLREETDKDFTRISRLLSHCAFDIMCVKWFFKIQSGYKEAGVRRAAVRCAKISHGCLFTLEEQQATPPMPEEHVSCHNTPPDSCSVRVRQDRFMVLAKFDVFHQCNIRCSVIHSTTLPVSSVPDAQCLLT